MPVSDEIVACIFARGGSKGLPGKNIKPLNGKPLIGYAIETGLASAHIDRVVVSTDDEEIARVARAFGAEVPFIRPGHLAEDDSKEWDAWQHALKQLTEHGEAGLPRAMVSIPPTAPLRIVEDVDRCIRRLLYAKDRPDAVITVREAVTNPYFSMVRIADSGRAELVCPGSSPVHRRQDAPDIYDMTSVAYVLRPGFVLNNSSLFEGRVVAIEVPRERAVDIDDWIDWELAKSLLLSVEG